MKGVWFGAALLLLLSSAVHAWWDVGHMLVHEIAERNFDSHTHSKVKSLMGFLNLVYPGIGNFVELAPWGDQLKSNGMHWFDTWHYIEKPYSPEGLNAAPIAEQNVVWAVNQAVSALSNPANSTFEKGLSFALLGHFIGDIHQPLHCGGMVNRKLPQGDQGGNLWPIQYGKFTNLHMLWDSIMGRFDRPMPKPLSEENIQYLRGLADSIIAKYPRSSFAEELEVLDVDTWADTTFHLQSFVYSTPFNTTPSDHYLEVGFNIAQRQIALGGYRLADMLHRAFASSKSHPRVSSELHL